MVNYIVNSTACRQMVASLNVTVVQGLVPTVELHETLLLVLGFGVFAAAVALLFTCIRKHIYRDKNTLDTAFDAGGTVSVGLTATTVVSQWTWAATLLYSCTVASLYGISGPFWYAAGATIQILLFAMVSVQLKTRAPGAKTFLQVIRARFGTCTHKVFVVYALAANIIVTANLMLGGAAVLSGMTKDMSVEYATMLMAAVIGTYTFIGGLGATFYVSFFNTAMICVMMLVCILRVYDDPDNDANPLGSIERVYTLLSCSQGPEGNENGSYLTILSKSGFMFGLITIASGFGTAYADQSYWQSSVAAKPRQGVLGFLAGGLVWFAIPFGLATTMGLGYIALSAQQDAHILTEEEIQKGLVLPAVAQRLFGRAGETMMIIMVIMAVTSTGSAEVIAVTSILVYDIYMLYLKPYRLVLDANSCILCGQGRGRKGNTRDNCSCESMTVCPNCASDDRQRALIQRAIKPPYTCRTHGPFREYTDYLSQLKNWCLLWVILAIVPLTVIMYILQLNLTLVHLFMGVTINSAVIPITLSMFWERLTGLGMMAGSIGGSVLALISWLSVSASYPGGMSNFKVNGSAEGPSLTGNLVSLLSGGLISVIVSLVSIRGRQDGTEVWEKTRDIDNPLSPWTELYAKYAGINSKTACHTHQTSRIRYPASGIPHQASGIPHQALANTKDLNLEGGYRLGHRPSLQDVQKAFRGAKLVSMVGSTSLTVILVILWPLIMITVHVMSYDAFYGWVTVSKVWAFLATIFIIVAPFINEVWDIFKAYRRNIHTKVNPEPRVSRSHATTVDFDVGDSKLTATDPVHLASFSQFDIGPQPETTHKPEPEVEIKMRTNHGNRLQSAASITVSVLP